jgi:hypothetical protein
MAKAMPVIAMMELTTHMMRLRMECSILASNWDTSPLVAVSDELPNQAKSIR